MATDLSVADIEAEVTRLRAAGWTREDFAKALRELLPVPVTVWVCGDCGSLEVEETAWVKVNTREELSSGQDGPRDVYWCPRCEKEVTLASREAYDASQQPPPDVEA